MAQAPRPYRLARRRRRRFAALIAVMVLCAGAIAAVLTREDLVGAAVRNWLSAAGVGSASWTGLDIGFGEARIEKFKLGKEVAAEGIVVRYRWHDLLRGRIAEAEIQGLALDLTDGDGGLVGMVRRRFDGTGSDSDASPPRLRIENARVRADVSGFSIAVALDAGLASDGSAEVRFREGVIRDAAGTRKIGAHGLAGSVSYAGEKFHLTATAEAIEIGGRAVAVDSLLAAVEVKREGGALAAGGRIAELVFRQGADGKLSQPFRAEGPLSFEKDVLAAELAITPPSARGALAHIGGRYGFADGAFGLRARVDPLKWEAGAGSVRTADLSPEFARVEIARGEIAAALSMDCRKGRCDGSADARFDNVSIAAPLVSIEGLNGHLRLNRLDPLTSAGAQDIHALRLSVAGGPIEMPVLDSPRVRFRIGRESDERIATIERAEVGLAGTRLAIADVAVAPHAATHRVILEVQDVDLSRLLPVLGVDGVTGTGMLSGAIPIEIKGDNAVVTAGKLTAAGPGVLRIQNPKMRQALAAGGDKVEALAQAMEDFRYSSLALAIDKDVEGEGAIKLSTSGHNPAVLGGHPLVLNVNLSGNVDRLLRQLRELFTLSAQALGATIKK